jgi:hypothetical protein
MLAATTVIHRNLTRRLERLEDRVILVTEEPRVLVIQFVSRDGQVVDENRITLPSDPRPAKPRRR